MKEPFLFHAPAGQTCTACGVLAQHLWLIVRPLSKHHSYCLSCAFTKTKAKELHDKLSTANYTYSTGAK